MKPATTEQIFELLDGSFTAAALGAAMELGLFWLLAEKPLSTPEVAGTLNIPMNRCQIWLQLLDEMGLLEKSPQGYLPSALARKTVLDAHSRETWTFLANEARSMLPAVMDLPLHICKPISTWEAQNLKPPYYFRQINDAPEYAARFTRMLYEIHLPLAEQLANLLDLTGVNRLMDLGGGSGVMLFALLRKHPGLTSLVVDVENVCNTGREIATRNGLEKRITYLVADFTRDELPMGFDMALLCDTNASSDALFRKIHAVLNPDGRLILVEQFSPSPDRVASSHSVWTFLSSLEYPKKEIHYTTSADAKIHLEQAGFRDISIIPVPGKEDLRWNSDWVAVVAYK